MKLRLLIELEKTNIDEEDVHSMQELFEEAMVNLMEQIEREEEKPKKPKARTH